MKNKSLFIMWGPWIFWDPVRPKNLNIPIHPAVTTRTQGYSRYKCALKLGSNSPPPHTHTCLFKTAGSLFHDKLGKPSPEWYTILRFSAARDDKSGTLTRTKLRPRHHCKNANTQYKPRDAMRKRITIVGRCLSVRRSCYGEGGLAGAFTITS